MQRIKDKMFKLLFRDKFDELESAYELLDKRNKEDLKKPSLADLYRDSVGLPMIEFNVDSTGEPAHYLANLSPEHRKEKISQLYHVYRNEVFQDMLNYWVNKFGNHALRRVSTDNLDTNLAIFSINGISMIRKELEKAKVEYEEQFEEIEKVEE